MVPVCLAHSTGRALTPWTYGSSPRCTRRPVRIEWRCVHCCWVTAPIPHCSTATARARWMWRPHLSLKSDSPVSAIHRAYAYFHISFSHLTFCGFFLSRWVQRTHAFASGPWGRHGKGQENGSRDHQLQTPSLARLCSGERRTWSPLNLQCFKGVY